MRDRSVNRENTKTLATFVGIMSDGPALQEILAESRPISHPKTGPRHPSKHWAGAGLKWGLVPFWADNPNIGHRLINTRPETVFEKPAFWAAAKNRRCVIPTSGFFERKRVAGINSVPETKLRVFAERDFI